MKEKIIAGSMTTALLLTPAAIFAQEPLQDPGANQPGFTQPNNQEVPGATTNNGGGDGFNWWWLLPLIAIPFIIPFIMRNNDEDQRRDRSYSNRDTRPQVSYHDIDKNRRKR